LKIIFERIQLYNLSIMKIFKSFHKIFF